MEVRWASYCRDMGEVMLLQTRGDKNKGPGAMRQGHTLLNPVGYQAEKEEPQPQVVVAFGLRITNCAPCRSSL